MQIFRKEKKKIDSRLRGNDIGERGNDIGERGKKYSLRLSKSNFF